MEQIEAYPLEEIKKQVETKSIFKLEKDCLASNQQSRVNEIQKLQGKSSTNISNHAMIYLDNANQSDSHLKSLIDKVEATMERQKNHY